MNIYLIVILFPYLFFVSLFPVLNNINGWIDISMGTFYTGVCLTLVNIIIILKIAKIIKLNLKGRLGKGMLTGVLHTPKPFSFAGENNLLHVQSTLKYYNNASDSMLGAFFKKDSKHPHAHFEPLKQVNLFADEIYLNQDGNDILFTKNLKSVINPYIDSDNLTNKTIKETNYNGMIKLIQRGEVPGITQEHINAVSKYKKDGRELINKDTEFVFFTRAIISDNKEDLIIGLDENFNHDMDAYTHGVEDNIEHMYPSTFFMTVIAPPVWIAFVTFFILQGGGDINFSKNIELYLYSSLFQIPFYYFLGWKYIVHYNRTSFSN